MIKCSGPATVILICACALLLILLCVVMHIRVQDSASLAHVQLFWKKAMPYRVYLGRVLKPALQLSLVAVVAAKLVKEKHHVPRLRRPLPPDIQQLKLVPWKAHHA